MSVETAARTARTDSQARGRHALSAAFGSLSMSERRPPRSGRPNAGKKDAERAQAAMAKAQKAQEREAKRQYQEARDAEALAMTAEVDTKLIALGGLLGQTLSVDDAVSFDSLKDQTPLPEFDGGVLAVPRPAPTRSSIPFRSTARAEGIVQLIPGSRKKYEAALAAANDARAESLAGGLNASTRRRCVAGRSKSPSVNLDLAIAKRDHDETVAELERERANQHQEIHSFERAFLEGDSEAISKYFSLVFERSPYPEYLQLQFRLAFVPESRQLVVEERTSHAGNRPGGTRLPICEGAGRDRPLGSPDSGTPKTLLVHRWGSRLAHPA